MANRRKRQYPFAPTMSAIDTGSLKNGRTEMSQTQPLEEPSVRIAGDDLNGQFQERRAKTSLSEMGAKRSLSDAP